MAPPSGGGFFAGRHGVIAEPALPTRSRAGPLWRRRRSLPNSAGPSSKERQGVNPLLAPSAFPMIFLKNSWAAKVPPAQDDSQFIAHDYGAVMAVSAGDTLILLKTLAFLKTTEPIFASFKRNTLGR